MKHDQINYFVVGLFVLLVGASFLAVLYRVTGNSGDQDQYAIYYQNVAGLKFGTPVYYEGYRIGQVAEVSPERGGEAQAKTRYRVMIAVKAGWQLPVDSVAVIISSGLLSAKSIDIKEGSSHQLLQPGEEISGQAAIDIMLAINSAAEDFHRLTSGIKPLLDNLQTGIDEIMGDMSALLVNLDTLATHDLKKVLTTAAERVDSPHVFREIDSLLVSLNSSAESLEQLLGVSNRRQVEGILGNFDALILQMQGTRGQMDDVLENLHSVMTEVGGLARDNRGELEQAVQHLSESLKVIASRVDAVTHHLEGSSRNMHEFSRQIRNNPALLLRGSAQPEGEGAQ